MSRVWRWLTAATVLWLSRRPLRRPETPRIVASAPPDARAETLVVALLACASLCGVGFVVVYALDRLPSQTQLLGAALGGAFAFVSAALVVIGKRLVPQEELEEEYPEPVHEQEQEDVLRILHESGDRLTRRRLLKVAGFGTGGVLAGALLTPALSLGPALDVDPLYRTPWRRGRRLVDASGLPYSAADVEPGTFYTAYPAGQPRNDLAAPLVVVRLEPSALQLPPERSGWAPDGILAFSKICTHAGCAIALYRTPLFEPTAPAPALVCPCHYSTFDPARGGAVLFGPAGRPLPQLPLVVDGSGHLRAGGGFSGPIGPSWWGVRER
jgi:ubiquinol-cytochrome c reductase iron-sulfur subunit